MSQPALAQLADLEARMGREVDAARALALIDDASAIIHTETGSAWIDDDGQLVADVPGVVVGVVCAVVQRVLANPAGATQEALGSYSASYANPTTDVFLTRAERRILRKAAAVSTIGSIELRSPYRRVDADDLGYMTVNGTTESLPMGPYLNPSE